MQLYYPWRARLTFATNASPSVTRSSPRTKSGKIVELAVRDVVHGRELKNRDALANPEALEEITRAV